MPALTGKGYDGLNIAQGDDASMAFFNMAMGTCTGDEKTKVMKDLEVYCGRDTEGMIWIVERLGEFVRT